MTDTPRRCTARRRDEGRCTNRPVRGAEVCRMHGGAAPQVRAAAAEREVDDQVARLVGQLEITPCDDPLGALAHLAGEVIAWKDAIGAMVAELTDVRRVDAMGGEQVRAEVLVFERAMDRCARVLTAIARLDLDTRMARISEQQAQVILQAVQAAITSAGITGTAAAEARGVAARHLRAVTSSSGDAG